jgi:hypothetical protein
MSHHPYEDLIFSDQELTKQEAMALNDHLQECDACYQLSFASKEIEGWLDEAKMIEPEPGFMTRWQIRFEAQKRQSEFRQNRAMLISTIGGGVVIFAAIIYLIWPMIQSPKVYLVTYLYQILSLFSVANLVQGFVSGLSSSLDNGITWLLLTLGAGLITLLSVIWVVSLRVLSRPRRVR